MSLRRSHVDAKARRPFAAALLVGVALCLGPTFVWPRSPGPGHNPQHTSQGLTAGVAARVAVRPAGLVDGATSSLGKASPLVPVRGDDRFARSVDVQRQYRRTLRVRQIVDMYYFKKEYKKRQRKRMRNWMYNVWKKSVYKWQWRKTFKQIKAIGERSGKDAPADFEALIAEVKPDLDNMLLLLDEMAIDGIMNTGTAMKLKNALFTRLLDVSTKFGFKKRTNDKFLPAYATLGYELPKSKHIRQPRPWQLPGHKTLYQIRAEKRLEVKRLEAIREEAKKEPEPEPAGEEK